MIVLPTIFKNNYHLLFCQVSARPILLLPNNSSSLFLRLFGTKKWVSLLQLVVIKTTTSSKDDEKAYSLIHTHSTSTILYFFSFLPAPGKRNLAESLYWGKRGKHEQFCIYFFYMKKLRTVDENGPLALTAKLLNSSQFDSFQIINK